jgi:hypothetical protein
MVNTGFYSWDTSFGLVKPRLRYSCVFCVNLGTFLSASCNWDGGSRASAQLTLNVPSMLPECALQLINSTPIDYYYEGGIVWAMWCHVANTKDLLLGYIVWSCKPSA